jgi:hypothetical protein
MKKLIAAAAFAALTGLAGPAGATVNIVANPNFDLNTPPGGTAPLDWTLTPAASGSDFYVGTGPVYGAFSLPNAANFGATGSLDDTLSQVLATVPGRMYTLSFELAHDSSNTENDFSAWFGGTEVFSLVNADSFPFSLFSFDVVATSSSTALAFDGREVPAWYGLDNVSVTSIPEARTWTMMLVGFACLCFAGYRTSRKAASIAG